MSRISECKFGRTSVHLNSHTVAKVAVAIQCDQRVRPFTQLQKIRTNVPFYLFLFAGIFHCVDSIPQKC